MVMKINKIILSVLAIGLLSGCAVFKSERQSIIPKQITLDSRKIEVIQQDAKAMADIAEFIKVNGIQKGDERAILLADGTKIILKYLGEPYTEVNGLDNKEVRRINEKAKDIVNDFAQERAEYSDELDKARDKQITSVNAFWDWKKLFAGGIITWIFVAIAVPVLCGLFPVIIPFVSFAWQGLKFGLKGAGVLLRFGFTGIINVIKAIEAFRDANKNTEVGKAFDTHMAKELDSKDKVRLDEIKNKFDI